MAIICKPNIQNKIHEAKPKPQTINCTADWDKDGQSLRGTQNAAGGDPALPGLRRPPGSRQSRLCARRFPLDLRPHRRAQTAGWVSRPHGTRPLPVPMDICRGPAGRDVTSRPFPPSSPRGSEDGLPGVCRASWPWVRGRLHRGAWRGSERTALGWRPGSSRRAWAERPLDPPEGSRPGHPLHHQKLSARGFLGLVLDASLSPGASAAGRPLPTSHAAPEARTCRGHLCPCWRHPAVPLLLGDDVALTAPTHSHPHGALRWNVLECGPGPAAG